MDIGGLRPKRPNSDFEHSNNASNIADATSVVLDIKKQKVKIKKTKIKDVAKGLAEIAFSMGETNDPDEYAEQMTEDILAAFKDIQTANDSKKRETI